MKAKELYNIVSVGAQPLVRIKDWLWDESFGEQDMIARVIDCRDAMDDTIEFKFDYNEHSSHNMSIASSDWYLPDGGVGNALEAGKFEPNHIHESIYFEADDEIPVELIEDGDGSLMSLFIQSGSKGLYLHWIEEIATASLDIVKSLDATKELLDNPAHKKLLEIGAIDCET